MSGFQLAGRRWLLRGFSAGRSLHGGPPTRRMVGACLYNAEYSHRGNLSTGIQQRAAKVAGSASVDGGEAKVGGAG